MSTPFRMLSYYSVKRQTSQNQFGQRCFQSVKETLVISPYSFSARWNFWHAFGSVDGNGDPKEGSNLMPFKLCEDCVSKCRVVTETTNDIYSYKRKGICYNVDFYCRIFGFKLYSFSSVVKCTAHRRRKGARDTHPLGRWRWKRWMNKKMQKYLQVSCVKCLDLMYQEWDVCSARMDTCLNAITLSLAMKQNVATFNKRWRNMELTKLRRESSNVWFGWGNQANSTKS